MLPLVYVVVFVAIDLSESYSPAYPPFIYSNSIANYHNAIPFYRRPPYFMRPSSNAGRKMRVNIRKSAHFATDDHRNAMLNIGPQYTVDMADENGLLMPFDRPEQMIGHQYLNQETENDCSAFPNGTNQAPHFFMCPKGSGPVTLQLHNAALTNRTGAEDGRAVDFSQPIRVFLDVTNYANRRYGSLMVDATLFRRSTGWMGCGWLYLPAFGYISNYRVCEDNPSCPIVPGRQTLELTIDPSPLFTGFFKYFQSKQVPYQLLLRLRNKRRPEEELLCLTYQMKVTF